MSSRQAAWYYFSTSEGKSYADAELVPEAAGSQSPSVPILEELSSHGKSWKTCIEYPESDGLRAQGAERRGLRGV
jgi:hypothetical protein